MKKIQNGFFTILLILGLSSVTANAQVNLSAHTASPGGVPHLTIMHLSDVLVKQELLTCKLQKVRRLQIL